MKTAQLMLGFLRTHAARLAAAVLIVAVAPLAACESNPKSKMPIGLASPYGPGAEVVLAVAPLRNESGVSIVDELGFSDTLVNEMQQTQGVSVLPMNRTLAAMRALRLGSIDTPADALALAKAAGADGVVVGSITAWEPYDPPTVGLTLAVIGRSPLMRAPADPSIDPKALRSAHSEAQATDRPQVLGALSVVSETLDSNSGETRELVRRYAEGRHDPNSALGWKRYVSSMSLYGKFACYEMSRRLFEAERQRLGTVAAAKVEPPPR
jgi:hypothetical protein